MIWSVYIPFGLITVGLTLSVTLVAILLLRVKSVTHSFRLFKAVAEGASDGLVLMARDSRIIWTNAAYSRIMGYPHGELLGRYPLEFALPPHLALPLEEVKAFRFDETEERFGTLTRVDNIRKDGSEFIHEFSHAAIDVGGEPLFLLAGRDITERVARERALDAAQESLQLQALTDGLTGLSNRVHMQTRLEALTRQNAPFAVLHIDVNRMKQVNDTHGHLAGDAILQQVASALKATAEADWLAARIGGDEFVLILPEISTLADAAGIGNRIFEHACRPFKFNAALLSAEVSIGAAVWNASLASADELLNRSDVALYEAKMRRNGSVVVYDDCLHQKHLEAQVLEREVLQAMQSRAFMFHFQPIANLATQKVEKFEMLIRWSHPKRGMVPPDVFLPIIDRLGLTEKLDHFVVETAEKVLKHLDGVGLSGVGLSINLSPEALSSSKMTELLTWLAECGRLEAPRISLEILECTSLTLFEDALPVRLLGQLRDAGFRLFLDDFGMGYAGLAHLATIPSTGLKINRGLTSMIDTDPISRAIVTALIGLVGELGLDLVVEGVENQTQIDIVRSAGCTVLQGFALARPLPLDQAIAWAQDSVETLGRANG